jgi:hypothetical protein
MPESVGGETMKRTLGLVAALALIGGACTQVVVESTSEVRPSRYAVLEVTRPLLSQDSAVVYVKRALAAEQLKLQPGNNEGGVIIAGPARFAAEGDQPALEATVTINYVNSTSETKFRIFASSVVEPSVVGGVDARLTALARRLAGHISK